MLKSIGFLTAFCFFVFLGTVWMEYAKNASDNGTGYALNDGNTSLIEHVKASATRKVNEVKKQSIPKVKEFAKNMVESAKMLIESPDLDSNSEVVDSIETDMVAEDEQYFGKDTGDPDVPDEYDNHVKWNIIKETEEQLMNVSNMLRENL